MQILIITLLSLSAIRADPGCRFAPSYPEASESFLRAVLEKEVLFLAERGSDPVSGLAVDSIVLDSRTGMPVTTHRSLDSMNEALHIAILAKVIQGHEGLNQFYSRDEALQTLRIKMQTLQ